MKVKVVTLFSFLLLALVPAFAQNNPYEIDDECYVHFMKAELLVGKDGFQEENDALLATAIAKSDTKARTLYYVEKLKNIIRCYTNEKQKQKIKSITPDEEKIVLDAMRELTSEARKTGYSQYYYYAYELVQNFYFNHEQFVKGAELVNEMQETALKNKEDYGIWMGDRYMVSLYVSQNDYISAKSYILRALDLYHKTEDPAIRRQSATRLYCDLADTYPIGHDSVRINLAKAEDARKQHLDTLRCKYYRAKLSAYIKDRAEYERNRDYCLADPYLSQISKTAEQVLNTLDRLIYATEDAKDIDLSETSFRVREIKYIANVAENYGFKDLAFDLEKRLVANDEELISKSNQSKLAELEVRMGNDRLSARIDQQTEEMSKVTRLVMMLLALILLLALVFSWVHIAHLKKSNDRVRMANEAKTRFVQNMSHEVRTPLNAIVGFSQLLSLPDGSFPPEEKEEFAGHIVNNTKMLTMLLDDILNVSAMDNGEYRITYEDGELHFMCQAAISSTEHRLQPGVRMYYEPESQEPFTFRTDPRRVQQILINLLTNSCKHTTEGEIKLTSSLKEQPGYVTFTVSDTGPGVPPGQAEKIFERFTKLNEFVQGTGLGLSICRDIASRMGANVYLDTTSQEPGARFKFVVPVVPPEQMTDN